MVTVSSAQLTAFAVLLLALIEQRCITVGAPFWIRGELPVFIVRSHAPNREVRTVTVRYEYMYRATPSGHTNIDTLGPIWTFSLRGLLTFVASGLDINGCGLSYFEGISKFTLLYKLFTQYFTL